MSLQKLVRISIWVTRKPGMSEVEFHRYWADNHGPLVQDLLVRHGIVRYNQYHITPEHKALAPLGVPSPYDGAAEFYVHRYEDMAGFYTDPAYLATVRPDEEKFVDFSKIVFTVGVDYLLVEDNQIIQHKGESVF